MDCLINIKGAASTSSMSNCLCKEFNHLFAATDALNNTTTLERKLNDDARQDYAYDDGDRLLSIERKPTDTGRKLGVAAEKLEVEASTRYHGVSKPSQDALHSQYGRSKPHPTLQPDRKNLDVDTREYWKWRVNNQEQRICSI
ncbi:hypothetical protein YA0050_21065 [Pseudomonas syringae]|nr:hypothetical protein [Pseudomonas syringae]MBI6783151.1 hypothetical protein [Pseudomonas syringae]